MKEKDRKQTWNCNDFDKIIVEGSTKILVPKKSIDRKSSTKRTCISLIQRAKLNRDFSIIAYAAFLKNFEGPKIFLEGLSGIGARGLTSFK